MNSKLEWSQSDCRPYWTVLIISAFGGRLQPRNSSSPCIQSAEITAALSFCTRDSLQANSISEASAKYRSDLGTSPRDEKEEEVDLAAENALICDTRYSRVEWRRNYKANYRGRRERGFTKGMKRRNVRFARGQILNNMSLSLILSDGLLKCLFSQDGDFFILLIYIPIKMKIYICSWNCKSYRSHTYI